MNNPQKSIMSLVVGMVTSQVFFYFFVYQSNRALHHRLTAISDAGYLGVPNATIMATLSAFWPAFYGGLFFTATLGIPLSLFTLAALWCWRRKVFGYRGIVTVSCLAWMGSVVMLTCDGVHPLITAWLIVVPMIMSVSTRKWIPGSPARAWPNPDIWLAVAGGILLLGPGLASPSNDLFIDIRDEVLLPTKAGRAINDFYYRYTLYPAEAFKALRHKQLKTCRIEAERHPPRRDRLSRILAANDYLPVPAGAPTDLVIRLRDDNLTLFSSKRAMLEISPERFFTDTGNVLRDFSAGSDGNRLLRKYTAGGLLICIASPPLFLIYGLLRALRAFFKRKRLASPLVAITCMGGAVVFVFLYGAYLSASPLPEDELNHMLASEQPGDRISGLKELVRLGHDIYRYPAYQLPEAPVSTVECYWVVKALGKSRHPAAYLAVLGFKDNPHPNIQCVFLEALGRLGKARDRRVVLEKITTSDHWYVQWYAFRALKDLGWRQKKST